MTTFWTPQHAPTQEQTDSLCGAVRLLRDVSPELAASLGNTPSDPAEVKAMAKSLVVLMFQEGGQWVLPIGSPAFAWALAQAFGSQADYEKEAGRTVPRVVFAHSVRDSRDEPQPDGTVKKVSVFKHGGWIVMHEGSQE